MFAQPSEREPGCSRHAMRSEWVLRIDVSDFVQTQKSLKGRLEKTVGPR